MSDISKIKCPHCKKEYQNFLATQLKAELATSEQKLTDANIKWAVEVKRVLAELAIFKAGKVPRALCPDCRDQCLERAIKHFKIENTQLKKAMEKIKVNSYPGLAVKESTLLNRIYKLADRTLNLKKKQKINTDIAPKTT